MPCRSDWPDTEVPAINRNMKRELDRVTRLLCQVCNRLSDHAAISPELAVWWEEHQEADRKREEQERAERIRERLAVQIEIDALEKRLTKLKGE